MRFKEYISALGLAGLLAGSACNPLGLVGAGFIYYRHTSTEKTTPHAEGAAGSAAPEEHLQNRVQSLVDLVTKEGQHRSTADGRERYCLGFITTEFVDSQGNRKPAANYNISLETRGQNVNVEYWFMSLPVDNLWYVEGAIRDAGGTNGEESFVGTDKYGCVSPNLCPYGEDTRTLHGRNIGTILEASKLGYPQKKEHPCSLDEPILCP